MAEWLPIPPLEMRELVGCVDVREWDNESGSPIWPNVPAANWRSYFDFGCGCGRNARRLIQQKRRPERYVGVDLHAGLIAWCQENLAPRAPGFTFLHHDVYNAGLNPNRRQPWALPLPVPDSSCSLIEAWSVFTHLVEGQAEFYLDELARILTGDGIIVSTFFLFDKQAYPMLQETQNALYVNDRDPTNAVIFDRAWLLDALHQRGLIVTAAAAPKLRGHQWQLRLQPAEGTAEEVPLPEDDGPVGRLPPPLMRSGADRIGLDDDAGSNETPQASRAELPPVDPLAVELAAAKVYIDSLREHIAALEAERGEAQRYIASLQQHLAAAQGSPSEPRSLA
jgi:SAM-dependent methyltransferase